jgi:hypothetical protein
MNAHHPALPTVPLQITIHNSQFKKPMRITTFTHLAFLINWIMDEQPPTRKDPRRPSVWLPRINLPKDARSMPVEDLSFVEVHRAAGNGDLIGLLTRRFGHIADFSLLQPSPHQITNLEQMEAALSQAAETLEGREHKASVEKSGLCLALAIVLETIQQQFRTVTPIPSESGPEEDSGPAFLPPWLPDNP